MTPMQEKFEKEFCDPIHEHWWGHVKAFIGRAEIESNIKAQIDVLNGMVEIQQKVKETDVNIKCHDYCIRILQEDIDRLKAQLKEHKHG